MSSRFVVLFCAKEERAFAWFSGPAWGSIIAQKETQQVFCNNKK